MISPSGNIKSTLVGVLLSGVGILVVLFDGEGASSDTRVCKDAGECSLVSMISSDCDCSGAHA